MKKEEFEIEEEEIRKGVKFTLKGRVNSLNCEELQYILDKALKDGKINIVLNMLWVEYLSSAGIRVILKTYKDAHEAGGKFGIEMPSQSVKNVLGMTALDEMLIN
jgi:anti-anti-sigma factor